MNPHPQEFHAETRPTLCREDLPVSAFVGHVTAVQILDRERRVACHSLYLMNRLRSSNSNHDNRWQPSESQTAAAFSTDPKMVEVN